MVRIVFAVALLAACNNNNAGGAPDLTPDSTPDMTTLPPDMADWGAPSTTYPAMHPDPPQVVSNGGPVLSKPVFVPVFFGGDDTTQRTQLEQFTAAVGATPYWAAATMEYGVGAGTATQPVELTETAATTLDDSMVQSWLAGKLNANDPKFPAPTANSVYVLYYPAGVTITLMQQGMAATSCMQFGAYHSNTQLDAAHQNKAVAYAVIPRCDAYMGLSVVDTATASVSHELAEAATDPYPQGNNAAYGQIDQNHFYWMFSLGGGEVGDMCAQNRASFTKFTGLDFTVQRIWSDAAAMAGHDPCQPALPKEVYFNSAPELNDTITVGGQLQMQGVHIPVGSSGTVAVDLFSDADTGGPWTVQAEDLQALINHTSSSFKFTWDRNQGQNGERLHLNIQVLKSSSQYGVGVFALVSSLPGANTKQYWFGLVGEQ